MHLCVVHDEQLFKEYPATARTKRSDDGTTAPGETRRPAAVNVVNYQRWDQRQPVIVIY